MQHEGSSPQKRGRAYPLEHLDRGMLAVMNETWRYSNAPTWELGVRGSIDPEHCRRALRDLMSRYPTCRSTVQSLDADREWSMSLHYVVHEEYDLEQLFTWVDLEGRAPEELETLRQNIRDRYLDPCQRFPFHLTLARVSPEESRLLFQQHHMLADARGFIALLLDFGRFLEHARRGTRPPPEQLEPYGKRGELEALGISRARTWIWGIEGLGLLIRQGVGTLLRPSGPSFLDKSTDYSGGNRTVYRTRDTKLLSDLRPLRQRHGVSLSAVLGAALHLADRRWNLDLGVQPGHSRCLFAVELRPRDREFRSFANHFSALYSSVSVREEPDPLALTLALDSQTSRQLRKNHHKKRFVVERALARRVPVDMIRKLFLEGGTKIHLSLSNIIPLDFPTLAGSGWCADDLRVTTPAPGPGGGSVSIFNYAGLLRFNFNYKASVVNAAQIELLADHTEKALEEVQTALARGC